MESCTPETDAAWELYNSSATSGDPWELATKLERQRNIAIAEITRILNNYGHKSDDDCNCDDCEHIRPIELALEKVKSLENVKAHPRGEEQV